MLHQLARSFRRPFSFLRLWSRSKPRPVRGGLRRRLLVEQLEDRTLLSGFSLQSVLTAYDGGAGALVQQGAAIVGQALGLDLPLLNETLDSALGLAKDIETPFQPALNTAASQWTAVQNQLTSLGFTINIANPDTTGTMLNPDANGNLLEVTWTHTFSSPSVSFTITGSSGGFSYLSGGGLFGGFTGTAQATFTVTLGVDVQDNQPTFFLLTNPSTPNLTASLSVSDTKSPLTGSLAVGDLANVNALATVNIGLAASLGFQATSSETDNKIRLADFSNSLSDIVTGGINGSLDSNQDALQLSANFSVQLSMLPAITWSGAFSDAIQNSVLQSPNFNLNEPDPQQLLGSLGSTFLSLGSDVPILGSLENQLNQPLPLINESIAQLTGLNNYLPDPAAIGSDLSSGTAQAQAAQKASDSSDPLSSLVNGSYQVAGGTLTIDVSVATIEAFLNGQSTVNGQPYSLISWTTGPQSITLANIQQTIPIYSLGIPDIASAEIDATIGLNATLNYDVGFGLDSNGFWIQAGDPQNLTQFPPDVSLSFSVTAGLQGQVEVLGFPLAEAGGNIGFTITPYVTLTAPPSSATPGKVYMSDLALFGSNPLSDILDDLSVGIEGDLTGNLYASVDLLLYTASWSWGVKIPVFNFVRTPSWPAAPGAAGGGAANPWSIVTQNGGVLTFADTPNNDHVNLSGGTNGSVTINWAGVGSQTYSGVTEFVFDATGGNNRLTTAPGFDIPIKGQGGSGNDYLHGGAGNDTLIGGSGNDSLIAGTGNDSITGGSGTDHIVGGDGSDTLSAGSGSGNDQIFGGAGNSTITANSGNDSIYAGSGNDLIQGGSGTDFIDGGSGSDTINAGTGSNDSIYGGSAGDNLITGSSGGSNLITGGGAGDTINGGAGANDTIYASAGGDSSITGGTGGGNVITGGGAGDTLAGAAGNNILYGGLGNETLYGGAGTDAQANGNAVLYTTLTGAPLSAGSNLLVAGPGNDVLFGDSSGHNTLQGGAGVDSFQAGSVSPQTESLSTASGQPETLAAAVTTTTANTITVADASTIAQSEIIQIDQEQMLVTNVNTSTNTLTVTRGFGNTSAATHLAGAAVARFVSSGSGTGSDTLSAGNVNDTLYAGTGGDYLAAGTGTDALFGGPGNDSIQLQFTPTGQQPPVDTVVGGAGLNTLVIRPDANTSLTTADPNGANGKPELPTPSNYYLFFNQVQGTANQYQATLANLNTNGTQGSLLGQVTFTMPADVEQVALEGGPGNDVIKVAPSVTRDMFLYGGPGQNTLYAGSGNDILVAGPGNAVLYGGTGDDVLYGGDMPTQDQQPLLDTFGQVTQQQQPTEGNDTLIAGPGNDELYAGSGNDVLIGGSAIVQNGTYQLIAGAAGRDVLVGGPGTDLLIAGPGSPGTMMFAGSGNNMLVGDNSGTDVLEGGAGADLLLGGSTLNNILIGGAGNNTLVAGSGIDFLQAGAGNSSLYASPNLTYWNQAISAAAAVHVQLTPPPGIVPSNTSLEGRIATDLNDLFAPTQALTATQQQNLLTQLQPLLVQEFDQPGAAIAGVAAQIESWLTNLPAPLVLSAAQQQNLQSQLNSLPAQQNLAYLNSQIMILLNLPQALSLSATQQKEFEIQLESLLDQENPTILADQIALLMNLRQTQVLNAAQQTFLNILQDQEFEQLVAQDNSLEGKIQGLLNLQLAQGLTAQQQSHLESLLNQDTQILEERIDVNQILGANVVVDTLIGGAGNDQLFGNPVLATELVGGSGADTFTSFNGNDTILGGSGGDNTLSFPGDGTFNLQQDAKNSNAVDVSLTPSQGTSQAWVVGNIGNVSNIQNIGIQTGAGNDTVNVNSAMLAGLNLVVQCGAGNDVIDAPTLEADATLLGGSGNDKMIIGTTLASGGTYKGGTGNSELDIVGSVSGGDHVTVESNTLVVDGAAENFSNFKKVVVVGDSGSNTFTLAGSIPGVSLVLEGGTGPAATNALTVQGDNNGDTIKLSQKGGTITVTGTITMTGVKTLTATATNMTSVSVLGGSGNDDLDASGMIMGVTLNGGGGGGGFDTLTGGQGNNTLFYNIGPGNTYSSTNILHAYSSVYNGGDGPGAVNELVFPVPAGDNTKLLTTGLLLGNGTYVPFPFANSQNIESYGFAGSASVARGDDGFFINQQPPYWTSSSSTSNASDSTTLADNPEPTPYEESGNTAELGRTTFYMQGADTVTPTKSGILDESDSYTESDLFHGYTYNPAVSGSINGLVPSFGVDLFSSQSTLGSTMEPFNPPSFGLLVEQGGTDYYSQALYTPTLQSVGGTPSWVNYSFGGELTSTDFGGSVPNFSNTGQPIQFGFYLQETASGFEHFRFVGIPTNSFSWGLENFAVYVDNGQPPQTVWPVSQPLTATPINVQTAIAPVTSLSFTGTDPNPNAPFEDATVSWGDGTTSAGGSTNNGNFNITSNHIYAADGTYTINLMVIDPFDLSYVSESATFTGGVELSNGNLDYTTESATTVLDSGVQSFLAQNEDTANPTLFTLHTDGSLWYVSGSSSPEQIGSGIQTMLLGPDGTLYALDGQGNLFTAAPGQVTLTQTDSADVVSIIEDDNGNLYKQYQNGVLDEMPAGSTTWTEANQQESQGAQTVLAISLNAAGSAINVVDAAGNSWQFNGSWTQVGAPHFAVNFPVGGATAGVAVPVTVTALNELNEPVADYTGAVQLTSGDPSVAPVNYTFTSGSGAGFDNGVHTFMVTFEKAGTQTITITDTSSGVANTGNVTVNPASAASLTVTSASSSVTVESPVLVTVTAYDAYGNVATGFTGTVQLGSSDGKATLPASVTFSAGPGTQTFSIVFAGVGSQSVTATDTVDKLSGGSTTFAVNPAAVSLSQSTVSVASSIQAGYTTTVTLAARDAFGNLETSGGLTVAFVLGGGKGTFSAVRDNSDGTYTANFSGVTISRDTITAIIANQPLTSTAATVAVFAMPPGPSGPIATDLPTFSWLPVAGAKDYALKVTHGKQVVLNVTKISGTTYALTSAHALTPGQKYSWSVTPLGGNGKAIGPSSKFTFQVLALAAPTSLSFNPGTDTFTWQAVTDVGHYYLRVTDSKTGQVVIAVPKVPGTSYTLTSLQVKALKPGHSYTWMVAAVSTNGKVTVWSASQKFTV